MTRVLVEVTYGDCVCTHEVGIICFAIEGIRNWRVPRHGVSVCTKQISADDNVTCNIRPLTLPETAKRPTFKDAYVLLCFSEVGLYSFHQSPELAVETEAMQDTPNSTNHQNK